MTRAFRIRAAGVTDASSVVEIVRGAFDPSWVQLLVYGCSGIVAYIEESIRASNRFGDTTYWVAARGQEVVGCSIFRRSPTSLFLDHIAVDPGARASGIGSYLLREPFEALATPGVGTVGLDALRDNVVAREWYRRLGFRTHHATDWWSIEPRAGAGTGNSYVIGYPQASATMARFGFGQIRVQTATGEHVVGLLGDHWFRISGAAALTDPGVQPLLAALDPHRRILAQLPENALPSALADGARLLATTDRYWAQVSELRSRLENVSEPR